MDKYIKILKQHGIKSNSNRLAVLQQLLESEKAFTLCSLSHVLEGQMDRTTVYRTLLLLTEKKIAVKIPCSDGNTMFALKSGDQEKANSTNFRCKCCQKVENLPDLPDEYLAKIATKKINLEAVAFEGYCMDCSR